MHHSKILKPFFSSLSFLMVFNVMAQTDEVFREVEQMPRFFGCDQLYASEDEYRNCTNEKLSEYVYTNVVFPEEALFNKVEGTAIVQFVVDELGKVTQGKVVKDIKGYFAVPILNVLNYMPNWNPGMKQGKAVAVMYTLPIVFRLPKEGKSSRNALGVVGAPTNIVEEEVIKEFAPDFGFWASWCGPCIKGFTRYHDMRESMQDLGVVMLNISIDKDETKWRSAISTHQPTGIHARVSHDVVREDYQMYNVPRYEIVGKRGEFLYLSQEEGRDILENFKLFLEE